MAYETHHIRTDTVDPAQLARVLGYPHPRAKGQTLPDGQIGDIYRGDIGAIALVPTTSGYLVYENLPHSFLHGL